MACRTSRARDIDQPRAVGTGVLGAFILGLFLSRLAKPLGLEQLDYPRLLGAYVVATLHLSPGFVATAIGWTLFGVWGVACSVVFAKYVFDRIAGPGWLQGMIYSGAGLFVLSSLFLSVVYWVNAVAHAGVPLDLFNGHMVLANFLGHCLFGLMLGAFNRRRLVF